MSFKIKRDVQTISAEAAAPASGHQHLALDRFADDQAWAAEEAAENDAAQDLAAMEELEDMERLARAHLAQQAESLRLPKGAYIHYIPQFYLH